MAHPWEARWKLQERLGKGGQGITHIASFFEDPTILGALKYLKNNNDGQARGRMYREVANLKVLANAGGAVPQVLDHNTENYEDKKVELFVVMDLIKGSTLSDYVEQTGKLDVDLALRFAISLCRTVKQAHSFPILHRDIKPENIMVRNAVDADLVVVDFGLSFNSMDERLTETDETFRNRFLDLPETNTPSGDRRDPRSDITAICAILYFCLTGHIPGQLVDGQGVLPHMRSGYSLRERIDDNRIVQLEHLFSQGFAPNLSNRFQSVDELVVQLDELLSVKVVDHSDPVSLANQLSMQLRAFDRTTQIQEFVTQANKLFSFIDTELMKYRSLGRFNLNPGGGMMGGGFGGGGFGGGAGRASRETSYGLPKGLDFVAEKPQPMILKVSHHEKLDRERKFVVASSGERCVLLASDYKNLARTTKKSEQAVWVEIAWYEGTPEQVFSLVAISISDWLRMSLTELSKEILAEHNPTG